jgi:hypothetical protein
MRLVGRLHLLLHMHTRHCMVALFFGGRTCGSLVTTFFLLKWESSIILFPKKLARSGLMLLRYLPYFDKKNIQFNENLTY